MLMEVSEEEVVMEVSDDLMYWAMVVLVPMVLSVETVDSVVMFLVEVSSAIILEQLLMLIHMVMSPQLLVLLEMVVSVVREVMVVSQVVVSQVSMGMVSMEVQEEMVVQYESVDW